MSCQTWPMFWNADSARLQRRRAVPWVSNSGLIFIGRCAGAAQKPKNRESADDARLRRDAVCYFAWLPLLLDGLRELRGESRSVRASPRSRSLSCYGYSPLIGRRLRRLVAWASLLRIRNRIHLQPLWVELLRRRRPLPLMNRPAAPKEPNLAKSSARHHAAIRAVQPPHSQPPPPAVPVEAAPVVAVAVTPADDSSAAMDAREENVPPAAGLMSLFNAVGKRSRPSSSSSASSSSSVGLRMPGRPGPWRPFGPEHGRTGRSTTPEEFFSPGVT